MNNSSKYIVNHMPRKSSTGMGWRKQRIGWMPNHHTHLIEVVGGTLLEVYLSLSNLLKHQKPVRVVRTVH